MQFMFVATVAKVQTLADQGLRVTLDLSEDEIAAAAKLMECKRAGVVITVHVEPEIALIKESNGCSKRQSKQSGWASAKE